MLHFIDWTILLLYLIGMLGLGLWLNKRTFSSEDYYVAGRNLPWWALGISTMATQSSANSFIGIPAFVALAAGGGLGWLQYELAVPLAMVFLMALVVPVLRSLKLVSTYEYIEKRFGPQARLFISAVFLISRGVGTGAGLYAAAIVVSTTLGLPLWTSVILLGGITVIYDTLGGMKGVVISDVIQMLILLLGLVLCILFIFWELEEAGYSLLEALPAYRFKAIDFSWGLGKESSSVPFFAFVFGGFFLYASYYGIDQSQAQRTLSAKTVDEARKVLFFNGLCRFPLTLAYLLLGIAAAGLYQAAPELQKAVLTKDYLVPEIIKMVLPTGLKGLLLAALLAAAMSSLDSALNSLSAVTMQDFVLKYLPHLKDKKELLASKITTFVWGLFIVFFALVVDKDAPVVVTINKIGSAFYGPLLAAFALGILSRYTSQTSLIIGVCSGVVGCLLLWWFHIPVHWMWWNLWGFALTVGTSLLLNLFFASHKVTSTPHFDWKQWVLEKKWYRYYAILLAYFVFMVGLGLLINRLAY